LPLRGVGVGGVGGGAAVGCCVGLPSLVVRVVLVVAAVV